MMENQEKEKYRVEMIERKVLSLNGVESVENFDESKVTLKTKLGFVVIRGEKMAVTTLDLDLGRLDIEGSLNALEYVEDKNAKMRAKSKSMLTKFIR